MSIVYEKVCFCPSGVRKKRKLEGKIRRAPLISRDLGEMENSAGQPSKRSYPAEDGLRGPSKMRKTRKR
jgi:hypothetical protein